MKEKKAVRWREAKLNTKINRLFTAIMLVYTLALGFLLLYVSDKEMKEYALQSGEKILSSVSSNIQSSFETVSTMSKMLIFSDEIREYLTEEKGSEYAASYRAIHRIYGITNHFKPYKSIYIFKCDGIYINVSNKRTIVNETVLKEEQWLGELRKRAGGYAIQINGEGLFSLSSGEPLLTFMRVIYDTETQKETGVIAINYDMSYLEEILKNQGGQIAVVDSDGKYLCGQQEITELDITKKYLPKNGGKNFSAMEKKEIISGYTVPDTPLQLLKYEKLSGSIYYEGIPWVMIAVIVSLSVICFVVLRFYISVWITRPIEKLVKAMKQVEEGWLHRVSVDVNTVEIRNLKDSYNQMLVQVNKLIQELVEQEKVAQQAKTDVMLEQLNPHFLYNTLETIGYMALESPREEIYEAVESLGEFYRYFLNKGEDMVPLKTEIAGVEDYLRIQKYRYGEILDEEYLIEKDCEDCLVPKLILQPLVENSLYHGIRPKGERGTIRIRAWREDGMVILSVYDTGIGMPRQKVEELLRQGGMGFGLKKTLARLETMYGRKRQYEISSEEGVFCEIRLYVPYRKEHWDVSSNDN